MSQSVSSFEEIVTSYKKINFLMYAIFKSTIRDTNVKIAS